MVSSYTCYNGMTIWTCMSTDETPVGKNGDILQIMDTEKQYRFDGENNEWIGYKNEGDDFMLIHMTFDDDTYTLDKTYDDIVSALDGGIVPVIMDDDNTTGSVALLYFTRFLTGEVGVALEFSTVPRVSEFGVYSYSVTVVSDNSVTFDMNSYPSEP